MPDATALRPWVDPAIDGRLSIRHDAGGAPAPYVAGTLLAARAVRDRVGLTRGPDTLLMAG